MSRWLSTFIADACAGLALMDAARSASAAAMALSDSELGVRLSSHCR